MAPKAADPSIITKLKIFPTIKNASRRLNWSMMLIMQKKTPDILKQPITISLVVFLGSVMTTVIVGNSPMKMTITAGKVVKIKTNIPRNISHI